MPHGQQSRPPEAKAKLDDAQPENKSKMEQQPDDVRPEVQDVWTVKHVPVDVGKISSTIAATATATTEEQERGDLSLTAVLEDATPVVEDPAKDDGPMANTAAVGREVVQWQIAQALFWTMNNEEQDKHEPRMHEERGRDQSPQEIHIHQTLRENMVHLVGHSGLHDRTALVVSLADKLRGASSCSATTIRTVPISLATYATWDKALPYLCHALREKMTEFVQGNRSRKASTSALVFLCLKDVDALLRAANAAAAFFRLLRTAAAADIDLKVVTFPNSLAACRNFATFTSIIPLPQLSAKNGVALLKRHAPALAAFAKERDEFHMVAEEPDENRDNFCSNYQPSKSSRSSSRGSCSTSATRPTNLPLVQIKGPLDHERSTHGKGACDHGASCQQAFRASRSASCQQAVRASRSASSPAILQSLYLHMGDSATMAAARDPLAVLAAMCGNYPAVIRKVGTDIQQQAASVLGFEDDNSTDTVTSHESRTHHDESDYNYATASKRTSVKDILEAILCDPVERIFAKHMPKAVLLSVARIFKQEGTAAARESLRQDKAQVKNQIAVAVLESMAIYFPGGCSIDTLRDMLFQEVEASREDHEVPVSSKSSEGEPKVDRSHAITQHSSCGNMPVEQVETSSEKPPADREVSMKAEKCKHDPGHLLEKLVHSVVNPLVGAGLLEMKKGTSSIICIPLPSYAACCVYRCSSEATDFKQKTVLGTHDAELDFKVKSKCRPRAQGVRFLSQKVLIPALRLAETTFQRCGLPAVNAWSQLQSATNRMAAFSAALDRRNLECLLKLLETDAEQLLAVIDAGVHFLLYALWPALQEVVADNVVARIVDIIQRLDDEDDKGDHQVEAEGAAHDLPMRDGPDQEQQLHGGHQNAFASSSRSSRIPAVLYERLDAPYFRKYRRLLLFCARAYSNAGRADLSCKTLLMVASGRAPFASGILSLDVTAPFELPAFIARAARAVGAFFVEDFLLARESVKCMQRWKDAKALLNNLLSESDKAEKAAKQQNQKSRPRTIADLLEVLARTERARLAWMPGSGLEQPAHAAWDLNIVWSMFLNKTKPLSEATKSSASTAEAVLLLMDCLELCCVFTASSRAYPVKYQYSGLPRDTMKELLAQSQSCLHLTSGAATAEDLTPRDMLVAEWRQQFTRFTSKSKMPVFFRPASRSSNVDREASSALSAPGSRIKHDELHEQIGGQNGREGEFVLPRGVDVKVILDASDSCLRRIAIDVNSTTMTSLEDHEEDGGPASLSQRKNNLNVSSLGRVDDSPADFANEWMNRGGPLPLAVRGLQQVMRTRERLVGPRHPSTAYAKLLLGLCYGLLADIAVTAQIKEREKIVRQTAQNNASSMTNATTSRTPTASSSCPTSSSSSSAQASSLSADFCLMLQALQRAFEVPEYQLITEAVDLFEKVLPEHHRHVSSAHSNLAGALRRRGRLEEGLREMRKASRGAPAAEEGDWSRWRMVYINRSTMIHELQRKNDRARAKLAMEIKRAPRRFDGGLALADVLRMSSSSCGNDQNSKPAPVLAEKEGSAALAEHEKAMESAKLELGELEAESEKLASERRLADQGMKRCAQTMERITGMCFGVPPHQPR
ncbi:unnamed protein product [Amoebophrya sp. A120]|nr:unnamed protein product [Amoebophrya sp. A120]|eukprot:GSA120T00018404001.1